MTVWKMFDQIAPKYDGINRVLSLGMDLRWRKIMARHLPNRPKIQVLDLATGTGDVLLSLFRSPEGSNIDGAIGIDMAQEMLKIGRQKFKKTPYDPKTQFLAGDATQLNLNDNTFDVTTISFGIRNVSDVPKALGEMYRVLKPEGRALILEFSMPRNPIIKFGNLIYLRTIVPLVGGLLSGKFSAFRYLNTSIEKFPYGDDFLTLMQTAGFKNLKAVPVSFGIATIYYGEKV